MKQPISAYQHIVDSLQSGGEKGLTQLTQEQVECYFVDYKEVVEDFSDKTSLGQYWDILAKAISGFGNALGGVLIFGVKDNDKSLSPFLGYKNFEALINEFISRSTNPKHEDVKTFSFGSTTVSNKGYVIVEIAQSQNRPLQVISNKFNHRYFYRSGESHNDIPHDVLAGMLGYKIPPKLGYQLTGSDISPSESFEFEIILRNTGSTIAKDVWFNIDIGIPGVNVLETNLYNQFEGVKLGNSCCLITKNSYRMAPQGMLSVLKIQIPKNKLDEGRDYHFYFTFGCDGSKINEFDSKFKGKDFNKIIDSSLKDCINFLQDKSPNHVIERL
ncbi:MAG TPA: ATP-binding protein [Bacteroidales bacterium]|nr:ATP-binding protein [Bacteroidales bacterium]